ncbi:MAG: hypothetical protein PHQ35_07120 [Phycisphaerae bacterium]|nr:hypothetical protein [Phycisphaerae bacterium]MDD5381026.1 hypothetical protein [Phycisphaerae bacterium]
MDISKFKDLIQKLSFLRNYSSLILPVTIILVAVLLFIPTQLMSSKLKQRIEAESISIGNRVKSLNQSAVSRNQWEIEQKYQQAYEGDANQMALLAKQSNQRELLSYKIFPKPKDASTLIFKEFGQRYRSGIDKLIAKVNAHDCPSDTELQKALQGSGLSTARRGGDWGEMGKSDVKSEVEATITEVLCREKAEQASVYVTPAELSGYKFWEDYEYIGMNTAIEDCWYWQLAYWIIEDVFDTIDAMNSGSSSVFTSPAKRLLEVNFVASGKGAIGGKAVVKPSYVLSAKEAITIPHTKRFCNDDIDVVHFNISVVVSTKAVLPFMQQLCSAKQHKFRGFSGKEQEQIFKHNQITVLESNITTIDQPAKTRGLYRYGEDAVVQLDLVCEYIFYKNSYDEIKPESIKELLKKK